MGSQISLLQFWLTDISVFSKWVKLDSYMPLSLCMPCLLFSGFFFMDWPHLVYFTYLHSSIPFKIYTVQHPIMLIPLSQYIVSITPMIWLNLNDFYLLLWKRFKFFLTRMHSSTYHWPLTTSCWKELNTHWDTKQHIKHGK